MYMELLKPILAQAVHSGVRLLAEHATNAVDEVLRVGQSWGDRISDTLDGRPLVDRPVADPVEMTAEVVMATYRNGNGNRWTDELDWLWRIDREQMLSLLDDVMDNGIRNPIVAGSDGRLWDGHRRVAVAAALQIPLMVQVIKGD